MFLIVGETGPRWLRSNSLCQFGFPLAGLDQRRFSCLRFPSSSNGGGKSGSGDFTTYNPLGNHPIVDEATCRTYSNLMILSSRDPSQEQVLTFARGGPVNDLYNTRAAITSLKITPTHSARTYKCVRALKIQAPAIKPRSRYLCITMRNIWI